MPEDRDLTEVTTIELVYDGTEMADGTVPVEDMIDALQGFSGAYEKVAKREGNPDERHRLRVSGLERGSSKIIVDIIEWIIHNPAPAGALIAGAGLLGKGAYKIVSDIAGVMKGKKSLQGQPINFNQCTFNDNKVVIPGGVQLSREQFDLLRTGELDSDLDKLTKPLEQGRGVAEFELKTRTQELAKVRQDERPYFTHLYATVTTTEDNIPLEGVFYSHSKRSNRGMFHTVNGQHLRYHYVGDDIEPLLRAYAYNGVVRVVGKVKFDSDGEPMSIDVREIQLTRALF
jgi:hypothetical protein